MGKGSKPRPVDPRRYAANYDAIFQVGRDLRARRAAYDAAYPDWICHACGRKHGRGWPEGHIATWHIGTCGICGKSTQVTEPRDYGHLRTWPLPSTLNPQPSTP
jgi:hypothetical protein